MFKPFDMGQVIAQGEAIKGSRLRNAALQAQADPNSIENRTRRLQLQKLEQDLKPQTLSQFAAIPGLENHMGQQDASGKWINITSTQKPGTPPASIKEFEYAKNNQGYTGTYFDFLRDVKRAGVQGQQAPNGYTWIDPYNPKKGVEKIPGFGKGESGDSAKLQTSADSALASVDEMERLFTDGKIDQFDIIAAQVVPNLFQTEDQQLFETNRQNMIDLIGRWRSGGAINADEETRFAKLIPRFGDAKAVRERKLKSFREMATGIGGRMAAPTATQPTQDDNRDITTMSDEELRQMLENL